MSTTNLSPAQRDRQHVRDGGGRYAPTARKEASVSLADTPPADTPDTVDAGTGTAPAGTAGGGEAAGGGGSVFPDRPEALTKRYDSVDEKVAACRLVAHRVAGLVRGRMETEAESIGYTLTRVNGMSTDGTRITAPYGHGWSKGDPEILRQSADTVSTALHQILESTEFRHAET